MQKLKILFITPAYWPAVSYGGPIQSVKLLAEELVKLGHSVSVFTLAYGLKENEFQQKEINGVEVKYFKYQKFNRWFLPKGFFREILKAKDSFDIFHINLIWDPISWVFGFILVIFNKKIIISTRGTFEEELIKKRSYFLKKIIYFLFIKYIFKKTSGFHFTSEIEKNKFFKIFQRQKPYSIIPNLFDYFEFQEQVDKNLLKKFNLDNKKYILYFGRINWKKRIEVLIDAFYELTKEKKDFYLAIIGSADSDYFKKLKNKVKELKLEDKIILDGRIVFGKEKIALFQNASLFVLPSISENFGYVVAEALASNVPVIVSQGVAFKEFLNKYNLGIVFEGNNEEELRRDLFLKMKTVLDDNKLFKNLKNFVKIFLEKEFNNKDLAQQMLNFYQSFL